MPTTDLSNVDTTPGGHHLFSPPAGFAGGEEEYAAWTRHRFDEDPGFRQYMVLLTRRVCKRSTIDAVPVLSGPFAVRLRQACARLDDWLHDPTTK